MIQGNFYAAFQTQSNEGELWKSQTGEHQFSNDWSTKSSLSSELKEEKEEIRQVVARGWDSEGSILGREFWIDKDG